MDFPPGDFDLPPPERANAPDPRVVMHLQGLAVPSRSPPERDLEFALRVCRNYIVGHDVGSLTRCVKTLLFLCVRSAVSRMADANGPVGGMPALCRLAGCWRDSVAGPGVELLLHAGADPNIRTRGAPGTPLHAAAAAGSRRALRLLLAAGANVDARDRFGVTPLGPACSRSHFNSEVIADLLAAGARVDLVHLCWAIQALEPRPVSCSPGAGRLGLLLAAPGLDAAAVLCDALRAGPRLAGLGARAGAGLVEELRRVCRWSALRAAWVRAVARAPRRPGGAPRAKHKK